MRPLPKTKLDSEARTATSPGTCQNASIPERKDVRVKNRSGASKPRKNVDVTWSNGENPPQRPYSLTIKLFARSQNVQFNRERHRDPTKDRRREIRKHGRSGGQNGSDLGDREC